MFHVFLSNITLKKHFSWLSQLLEIGGSAVYRQQPADAFQTLHGGKKRKHLQDARYARCSQIDVALFNTSGELNVEPFKGSVSSHFEILQQRSHHKFFLKFCSDIPKINKTHYTKMPTLRADCKVLSTLSCQANTVNIPWRKSWKGVNPFFIQHISPLDLRNIKRKKEIRQNGGEGV